MRSVVLSHSITWTQFWLWGTGCVRPVECSSGVQNLLIYAVTRQTAAELITEANADDPYFGLMHWNTNSSAKETKPKKPTNRTKPS